MKTIVACVMSMGLGMALVSDYALAKGPAENVSAKKHPHISRAQVLSNNAFEEMGVAQKDNEFDMEGHAAKAKELLEQANNEMKLAAGAANENKGKK
jgi:hypothetical protein